MANRRVFISYSHDSESHRTWVVNLANTLKQHDIDVILDQFNLDFGDDLPKFMEGGIRDSDRVLVICTDDYNEKANEGVGGVGYEKTIVTASMLALPNERRKFIPVVRNVTSEQKLPTFFGAAYYADLSDGDRYTDTLTKLIESILKVEPYAPKNELTAFVKTQKLPEKLPTSEEKSLPSAPQESTCVAFSERFAQAFPGVRGIEWYFDQQTIVDRLGILLESPIKFVEGSLAGWWRGPQNLHIDTFEHIEDRLFLMGVDELNIKRIAAVHQEPYYRHFVYVETNAMEQTGIYDLQNTDLDRMIQNFGYAWEEYGLVDENLPISRAEYDDGAAIIDGRPIDVRGRTKLRARYLSNYNFIIAPFCAPLNSNTFDYQLQDFLNRMLLGEDVFAEMCREIRRQPRRHEAIL